MLYKIAVFKEIGNKRKKIFGMEITARSPINALERACIRFGPDRIIEMRQVDDIITRPKITRIERNGLS